MPADRVVHVTGLPGSGKSTLAAALARDLGIVWRSIDGERVKCLLPGQHWPIRRQAAWHRLDQAIRASSVLIVETVGASPQAAHLLSTCDVLTVAVRTPDEVRRVRLEERSRSRHRLIGNPVRYLAAVSRITRSPVGDLTWDGTLPIGGPDYGRLRRRVGSWLGVRHEVPDA